MAPTDGIRCNSMAKLTVTCLWFLISLTTVLMADASDRSGQANRGRAQTDPVSTLFSELGNLFLDIDETLAVQTAPKIELEGLVTQMLKPSNEYFSDVQENYRKLRRRLGSIVRQTLSPQNSYTDRDLSTVGPTNSMDEIEQDSTAAQDAHLVKGDSFKTPGEEGKDSFPQPLVTLDGIAECSLETLNNPFLESDRSEECSRRLERLIHSDDRLKKLVERKGVGSRLIRVPLDPDLYNYPQGFFRRGGDISVTTPKPQGRILGDLFYSESSFDRNLRQLLRDHGKWILDNPLLTRWRKAGEKDNSDTPAGATKAETDVTTESSPDMTPEMESTQDPVTPKYNTEIPASDETNSENRLPPKSASYYRVTNRDDIMGEEVEVVLKEDPNLEAVHISETEISDSEKSVILAFTPDGIPLKLRIGPEIKNPSRFLHKVLQSAGVNLNVPVESYDNLEPVGREVMKFGAGILIRPTYYNLSNRNDLRTLLRTLKSNSSEKSK